jgi:hypothetical protein
MNKIAFAFVAPLVLVGLTGFAQASSLTLTLGPALAGSVSLENFDTGYTVSQGSPDGSSGTTIPLGTNPAVATSWGSLQLTNAGVVQNSLGSWYAAPFNPPGSPGGAQETTPYLAVYANGSATFTLNQGTDYFGLQWGSVDAYNTLTFYGKGGTLLGSIGGQQVIDDGGLTAGSWGVGGTAYANIVSTAPIFQVVATSSSPSFEFDNTRVAAAPLPAALPMFGAVLAGLGAFGWRRTRAKGAV